MSLVISQNSSVMNKLPTELAKSVQSFLPQKEAFSAMRLVCQNWSRLIPLEHLNIEESENFSDTQLASLSTTGRWKDVRFTACPKLTSKALEELPKAQLKRLDLMGCEKIRDFTFLSSFPLQELHISGIG